MDIIASIFTTETIGLAIICIVGLVSLATALRLLFKGRNTYAEHHKIMAKRIRATTADIDTSNKSMSCKEHLHILTTALTEGITLWGDATTMHVHPTDDHLIMTLPQGRIRIDYVAQTKTLRSIKKTLSGNERWRVQGPEEDTQVFFENMTSLEEYIATLVHGKSSKEKIIKHTRTTLRSSVPITHTKKTSIK